MKKPSKSASLPKSAYVHPIPDMPSSPEFKRLNASRVNEGMEPLPDDTALNLALHAAGVTHCFEKPYWWAVV